MILARIRLGVVVLVSLLMLPLFVSASRASVDIEQIGPLLKGLAQVDREDVSSCVIQLLATERAPSLVSPLLGYYSANSDLFNQEEHLLALIQLAGQPATDPTDAVKTLDTLAQFDVTVKGATKRALDDLRNSSKLNLRESALVLLARSKDKAARRDLLSAYRSYPRG